MWILGAFFEGRWDPGSFKIKSQNFARPDHEELAPWRSQNILKPSWKSKVPSSKSVNGKQFRVNNLIIRKAHVTSSSLELPLSYYLIRIP